MLRSALACALVLVYLRGAAAGQFVKDPQQPIPLDPEYRKLDALVSFLRARNAEQFAIRSPKGIDEASFVPIGGMCSDRHSDSRSGEDHLGWRRGRRHTLIRCRKWYEGKL